MKMNNKLDEGPILKTKEIEIDPLYEWRRFN